MIKTYLESIVKQMKNYSATLEKTSIFIDKPWALIDDELEIQKLIFKSNKELILSKNGQVQIGRWDYFPEAKSLLIDRGTDKILCNEAFIDNGVMILKLDGTNNNFFVLANENVIPDLDAQNYLKKLRHQKLKIVETVLSDGKILEIQIKDLEYQMEEVGNFVTIDAEMVKDGKYQLEQRDKYLEVKSGKIFKILTDVKYINPDKQEITIQQKNYWNITKGDEVYIAGKLVENSILNFTQYENLIIEDGKVLRLENKNRIFRWFSNKS